MRLGAPHEAGCCCERCVCWKEEQRSHLEQLFGEIQKLKDRGAKLEPLRFEQGRAPLRGREAFVFHVDFAPEWQGQWNFPLTLNLMRGVS